MAVTNGITVGGSTSVASPADFASGGVIYSNDMNAALRNASIGSSMFYAALAQLDTSATSYTMSNALDTTDASMVTAVKNSLISAFQKCDKKLSVTSWNTAKTVQSTTNYDGTSAVAFTLGDTLVNNSGTINVSLNKLRITIGDSAQIPQNKDYDGSVTLTLKFDDTQFYIDSNNVIHLRT